MVNFYNFYGSRPIGLTVCERVQSRPEDDILVDPARDSPFQTILSDPTAQAKMGACRGDYHRHKRWVPVAQRRLGGIINEFHRYGIVQNLGVFIEHLMGGAANRGKDGRLAKSTKTHYRNSENAKASVGPRRTVFLRKLSR